MSKDGLTVCLSFDFDATSGQIVTGGNLSTISRGEFGPYAIPRILKMLDRQAAKATFFTPGHTALAYPGAVQAIAESGHEIGHHGWVHEDPAAFDRDGEERNFVRGLEALDETVPGSPIKGYRSPAANYSPHTIDILIEHGMAYDSTFCATDFWPYYVRQGDQVSTSERYVFGQPSELVAIPFAWALNDFSLFEFAPGWSYSQHPPSHVFEIWREEFDFALANAPGGVFTLLMHPEVIGRGSRLTRLEAFLAHMGAQPGVRFETLFNVADRWRTENPIDEYKARKVVQAPSDDSGERAGGDAQSYLS